MLHMSIKEVEHRRKYVSSPWGRGAGGYAIKLCSNPLPLYTAISRKVVGKNVQATIPKGNMGYDQHTVPDDCSCRAYFGCFPLALANICPWPPVPFFQISLKNGELKTTHNTFQGLSRALFPTTFLEIAVYHF